MNAPIAELRGVTKAFGLPENVRPALKDIDFECRAGEIHALVGENGAGKSTLVGVLAGMVNPDRGEVIFGGHAVSPADRSPRTSRAAGIAAVFQHETLVPTLRVSENLAFGTDPGFYSESAKCREIRELCDRFRLEIDPSRRVGDMSAGERQRAELLRALSRGAKLLLLDEPTAVLAPAEVEILLGVMRRLREDGCGIVLVSHRLPEVREVADRVTVLRAGERVGEQRAPHFDISEIARLMVGEVPPTPISRKGAPRPTGDPVLSLDRVSTEGTTRRSALRELSLAVEAGEIVGVAGIEGNGQLELEELLVGERAALSGRVLVHGEPIKPSVRALRARGVAELASDRTGLLPGFSVALNLVAKASYDHGRFFSRWQIHMREIIEHAYGMIAAFGIRPQTPLADVMSLSGGNAQKVAVAREFDEAKSMLIAFHPTRGLDFAAAGFVRNRIAQARNRGLAVLLVSADLDELFLLADRMEVLSGGRLTPVPDGGTREEIGELMLSGGVE